MPIIDRLDEQETSANYCALLDALDAAIEANPNDSVSLQKLNALVQLSKFTAIVQGIENSNDGSVKAAAVNKFLVLVDKQIAILNKWGERKNRALPHISISEIVSAYADIANFPAVRAVVQDQFRGFFQKLLQHLQKHQVELSNRFGREDIKYLFAQATLAVALLKSEAIRKNVITYAQVTSFAKAVEDQLKIANDALNSSSQALTIERKAINENWQHMLDNPLVKTVADTLKVQTSPLPLPFASNTVSDKDAGDGFGEYQEIELSLIAMPTGGAAQLSSSENNPELPSVTELQNILNIKLREINVIAHWVRGRGFRVLQAHELKVIKERLVLAALLDALQVIKVLNESPHLQHKEQQKVRAFHEAMAKQVVVIESWDCTTALNERQKIVNAAIDWVQIIDTHKEMNDSPRVKSIINSSVMIYQLDYLVVLGLLAAAITVAAIYGPVVVAVCVGLSALIVAIAAGIILADKVHTLKTPLESFNELCANATPKNQS